MGKQLLKFKSKRDWLVVMVYAVLALALVLIWVLPYTTNINNDLLTKIIGTSLLGAILVIFTWAVFSTYYILEENYLICVSGPIRTRVFYSSITDVKPSYSGWSSLALAFDRVVIICGKSIFRRMYVSPNNKAIFIEELKKRINK